MRLHECIIGALATCAASVLLSACSTAVPVASQADLAASGTESASPEELDAESNPGDVLVKEMPIVLDEAAGALPDDPDQAPAADPNAWTIEYIPAGGGGFTSNGGLSFIAVAAGIEVPAGYAGVEDPWVSSGRYSTGDPELDEYTKSFCDAHTDPGMDFSDNAYYTFLPASWAEYIENADNQDPQGSDWMYVYAKQYWRNSGGNCYEVAAAAAFILQYYGYDDAYAQPCLVNMQSGAWGDHSLIFVTNHTGAASLCDTSRGSNGWMLPAGSYNYTVKDIGQPDLANARW